jgi:hypothetical protein
LISIIKVCQQQEPQSPTQHRPLIHLAALSRTQNFAWTKHVFTPAALSIAAKPDTVIQFPLQLQGGVTHLSSIAVDQLLAQFKLQLSTTLLTWPSSIQVPIVTLSETLAS